MPTNRSGGCCGGSRGRKRRRSVRGNSNKSVQTSDGFRTKTRRGRLKVRSANGLG
jgi:hypothetical protein